VTRFVVDSATLLAIAAGEIDVATEHQLLAPTLARSQALAELYAAARRAEITDADGRARARRINTLRIRYLGDRALQQQAWKVAAQLGWESTYDAEYVALTQLQADALVTGDAELALAVAGLVTVASIDALRTASPPAR
jgi:indolepyruvate ferredoxin oxidoreductase alpha subunit